jgi:hypothetical protein
MVNWEIRYILGRDVNFSCNYFSLEPHAEVIYRLKYI